MPSHARISARVLASVLLVLSATAVAAAPAAALPQASVPATFWTANGTVDAVASSGNGTAFIGGSFDYLGPITGGGAAINVTSQAVDMIRFVDGTVNAAVADGTGGVYIGGDFTAIGGVTRQRLAHINADGTVDAGWTPAANGPVHALASNGVAIWVGGEFTTMDGQPRRGLAQVLLDGSLTTFVCDLNTGGKVYALGLFTSTLVVAGQFSSIGGSPRNSLAVVGANTAAVLHPRADIELADGSPGTVRGFALIGTTIYLGGKFDRVGDSLDFSTTARQNIASFDGGALTLYPWNPGANDTVSTVATDGTTIWAGGKFTSTQGDSGHQHLAAYSASTTDSSPLITSFKPTISRASGSPEVEALAVSGGRLFVGGSFSAVSGAQRTNLASFTISTGALVSTWAPVAGGPVKAIAPLNSTRVYVGGAFTSVGGVYRQGLAEISTTTGAPTSWAPNVTGGAVRDLAVMSGVVYAGGAFTSAGGQARLRLAAFSAADGSLTSWNPGADGEVRSLAVTPGGVYAGGAFGAVGGQPRAGLARIGTDGVVSAFAPAVSGGTVEAIALSPFGDTLYAGGSFASVGGAPRARLAAVSTASGGVTSWDPGADGTVRAMGASAQAVYVGGEFATAGGAARARLAALSPTTGEARSGFSADANGTVQDLVLSPTAVYVTGAFTTIGGAARSRIAGVDGTTGAATAWSPTYAPGEGQAVATVGETVVAGSTVSAPSLADRGVYVFDGSAGSGSSTTLRCGPVTSGACLEARLPGGLAWGALSPGATTTSGEQRFDVVSNKTWDVRVSTDAPTGRFREWDGSGYVASPRTLTHPLQAAATRLGTPIGNPAWSSLSSSPTTLLAGAPATDCTAIPETCIAVEAGVQLRQQISYADAPLEGPVYRITVTYDVSQAL